MSQVNLHCHSEHSFLDGYSSVSAIARRVREVGSDAVALTDHNEVNGHLAFQKACRAEGVHPVLGIEADWVTDIAWTREHLPYPSNRSHICLLAADNRGLANLWALSSEAYTDRYRYHKPLLDPELMRRYSEGIYASDGCMITQFSRYVEAGDDAGARNQLGVLADIYRDRFYVELHTWQFMDADTPEKRRLNDLMGEINRAKVRYATEMGLPMVVVNDSHHAHPDDWDKKELVWNFNTRKNPDQGDEDYGQKADHLMGGDELYHWMGRHGVSADVVDEAIKNAAAIALNCTAEITPTLTMPRLTDTEADDVRMLIDYCEQGFSERIVGADLNPADYYDRMEEELRLIVDKRFSGYFLVVRDYVAAAKTGAWSRYVTGATRQPMLVGPGRGSAGGSLVAYLLGITTIDPIRYGLLFSRFLSASRKGYPDIDCDFPQSLRPGLKEYLGARYGHDHVCAIGTLTRSQPKAILKDLGRAMKIPMGELIAMSKIIEGVSSLESDEDASWDEVVERKGGALAEWAKKGSQYRELLQRVGEMSGIVRQAGVHPSGVVVSNLPLLGSLPTRVKNATTATQLDMNEVEELGAVKLDLLGLRHLDTLMVARDLVLQRHDVWLDYVGGQPCSSDTAQVQEFTAWQFRDPAIWPQIDAGQTAGIFQLETPELTRLSVEMRPRTEVDVAALLSIVRPGVKDAHLDKTYLRRRHGAEPVVYEHPAMEGITGETYGILVYQEQMMEAARTLAGFTADEADDLRKMLGKKKMDALAAWEGKFVQGCLDNPVFRDHYADEAAARQVISHIWASISAAGRYSFNKSHAVGYAIMSCWEIWTKHYFPQEYIVALMATDSDNINRYLREARKIGVTVLPPDINLSDRKFTLGDNEIRYGLDTIRGVGKSTVDAILANRPYTGLEDFLARVPTKSCGKTQVEALIKIGAFDAFGPRADLMTAYHDQRILDRVAPGKLAKMTHADRVEHVAAWRDKHADKDSYRKEFAVPDFSDEDVVYAIEQELVGNYVTIDPMMRYLDALAAIGAIRSPADMEQIPAGENFVIGGQLTKIRAHVIQKAGKFKGKTMAFLTIDWNEEEFEVTAFPEVWSNVATIMREGKPVACHVVRDDRGAHLRTVERLDILFDELRSRS